MKSHQKIVSQWLEQLGQELGCGLLLEEDGHCIIPIADNSGCVIEVPANAEVPCVFIYLPLVNLPENSDAQLTLARAALQLNLFGLLTGGCQIALDERSDYLVLSFSAMINAIDYLEFKHILNDMFEIAPDLRQRLGA